MFVGDFNNGRIYDFKLNGSISKNATGMHKKSCNLIISNTWMSGYTEKMIFGKGFNGITDIKIGPIFIRLPVYCFPFRRHDIQDSSKRQK